MNWYSYLIYSIIHLITFIYTLPFWSSAIWNFLPKYEVCPPLLKILSTFRQKLIKYIYWCPNFRWGTLHQHILYIYETKWTTQASYGHIFPEMCLGVAGAVHPDLVTVSFWKKENKCSFQPNKLLFILHFCIVDMLPWLLLWHLWLVQKLIKGWLPPMCCHSDEACLKQNVNKLVIYTMSQSLLQLPHVGRMTDTEVCYRAKKIIITDISVTCERIILIASLWRYHHIGGVLGWLLVVVLFASIRRGSLGICTVCCMLHFQGKLQPPRIWP